MQHFRSSTRKRTNSTNQRVTYNSGRRKKKTRIVILSDRIFRGSSAYTKLTREFCFRLKDMGHSVAHIPMGYANRMGNHVWNDILIYTSGANAFGEDVAYKHYNDFAADIIIALKEPWVFQSIFLDAMNFCPFAIIDHDPVSSHIISRLTAAFKVIAPSRFAQRQLKNVNKESNYLPHGVRTDWYKPMDKAKCRELWYLEPDDFIVGIVAMNRVRKMIPRQIRVYKRFLENNPDVKAHLFLWTNMNPPSRPPELTMGVADAGVNLIEEIMRLDLAGGKNDVRWMDPNDFTRA